MKKTLLVAVILLQFTVVGCSKTNEKPVDTIAADEAYLQKHNEMSAEETGDSLENLKIELENNNNK